MQLRRKAKEIKALFHLALVILIVVVPIVLAEWLKQKTGRNESS